MEPTTATEREKQAFKTLASPEQKVLVYLIVEDKRDRYSFLKLIVDNISEGKSTIYNALKNLETSELIEIIKKCPYCKKPFEKRVPPSCPSCQKRLLPESANFDRKKTWPYYLIRLKSDKKEQVFNFLKYCSQLYEWLQKN